MRRALPPARRSSDLLEAVEFVNYEDRHQQVHRLVTQAQRWSQVDRIEPIRVEDVELVSAITNTPGCDHQLGLIRLRSVQGFAYSNDQSRR